MFKAVVTILQVPAICVPTTQRVYIVKSASLVITDQLSTEIAAVSNCFVSKALKSYVPYTLCNITLLLKTHRQAKISPKYESDQITFFNYW